MHHEPGILMYWLYSVLWLSCCSFFGRLTGHHDSLFACPSGQTKELRQIVLSLAQALNPLLLLKNAHKDLKNKIPVTVTTGRDDGDFFMCCLICCSHLTERSACLSGEAIPQSLCGNSTYHRQGPRGSIPFQPP